MAQHGHFPIVSHSWRKPSRLNQGGAAIAEALAAAMIIGLFMGGLFQMNALNVRTMRSGRETVAASFVLQERVDQIRNTTWANVSNAAYLENLLDTSAASSGNLPQLSEQITISAYPVATPAPTSAVVTRAASGTTNIVSSNADLAKQRMVRADVAITWQSTTGSKTRTRTLSTIIAEGGIVR
jgi:hypothetical protein